MELTGENVHNIMVDCLFDDDVEIDENNLPDNCIVIEGILNSYGLKREGLEQHKDDIISMVNQLPTEFIEGGGWSFLNMCMRNDGEQWTGFHWTQEQLLVLGIGVGAMQILLPREVWNLLPGGMPYVAVTTKEKA